MPLILTTVSGWLPVEMGLNPSFGLCDRYFPTICPRHCYCAPSGIGHPRRIHLLILVPGRGDFYLHIAIAKGPHHGRIVRRCNVFVHRNRAMEIGVVLAIKLSDIFTVTVVQKGRLLFPIPIVAFAHQSLLGLRPSRVGHLRIHIGFKVILVG